MKKKVVTYAQFGGLTLAEQRKYAETSEMDGESLVVWFEAPNPRWKELREQGFSPMHQVGDPADKCWLLGRGDGSSYAETKECGVKVSIGVDFVPGEGLSPEEKELLKAAVLSRNKPLTDAAVWRQDAELAEDELSALSLGPLRDVLESGCIADLLDTLDCRLTGAELALRLDAEAALSEGNRDDIPPACQCGGPLAVAVLFGIMKAAVTGDSAVMREAVVAWHAVYEEGAA